MSQSVQDQPAWSADTAPETIIGWALEQHPDVLMTSAFNLNGTVLLDFAAKAGYQGEVVFVDTGYHFPETLQTLEITQKRYPQINFVTLNASLEPEFENPQYASDPNGCCAVRKIVPLQNYLKQNNPSALLNARSREQASTRASIGFLEVGTERLRVNPLAYWTREELEAYAKAHDLPVNPLYWSGFLSIGCWPCTRAVRPGEDPRAGRWAGTGKTECGLWVGEKAV